MKLKLDEAGHAVLKEGNPVYVNSEGKDVAIDVAATVATISRLNGEAKGHRERAEGVEAKLRTFELITDVPAAIKALEIVEKLDTKKLLDAGEVDRVRAEAKTAFEDKARAIEEKYKPIVKKNAQLEAALVAEKVGGSFSRSKFIAEKMAIPADLVQSKFGGSFRLEGDKVIAYGQDDKQIFSRANPGEVAGFDEALEILVDAYPYRDNILKGTGASGGGANGGGGGTNGGKRLARTSFEALAPDARMAHIKAGGIVTDA